MWHGGIALTALLRIRSCSWRIVSRSFESMMCMRSFHKPNSLKIGLGKTQRMSSPSWRIAGCFAIRFNRMKRLGIAGQNTSILPQKKPSLMVSNGQMNYHAMMLQTKTFLWNTKGCGCLFRNNSRMVGLLQQDEHENGSNIISR